MVRGVFTGALWGGVVGLGMLATANALVKPISPQDLAQIAQEAEAANAVSEPVESVAEDDMAQDDMAQDGMAQDDQGADVETDGDDTGPEAGTENAGDTTIVEESMAEPEVSGDAPSDTQAPTAAEIDAPEAMPADPDVTANEGAALPAATGEGTQAPEAAAPLAPTPDVSGDAPELAAPNTGEDSSVAGLAQDQDAEAPVLAPPLAQTPSAPDADAQPDVVEAAPDAQPENLEIAAVAPEAEADQEETSLEPAGTSGMGEKVGSFTEREDERKSTRLPTVGDEVAEAEEAPIVAEDLPAIVAFSADYTGGADRPQMSVVLVDIGEIPPEDPAVAALPFDVAFGVDALASSATDRSIGYRNAGREVMAIVALPDGSKPADVAVALNDAREQVPVSVGFLDVPEGRFQNSREIAAQVVASAVESGHGVVSMPMGLNAVEAEAKRAGAPAGFIFRDFDGKGQDINAMKRFLDQAAFRATIEGNIVVLGRAKADTFQALAEWSLGSRAQAVAMVPLSHLLTNPYVRPEPDAAQ